MIGSMGVLLFLWMGLLFNGCCCLLLLHADGGEGLACFVDLLGTLLSLKKDPNASFAVGVTAGVFFFDVGAAASDDGGAAEEEDGESLSKRERSSSIILFANLLGSLRCLRCTA